MTGHRPLRHRRTAHWALARTAILCCAALIGCTSWGLLVLSGPEAGTADRTSITDVLALGDSVPAGTACGCEPFPDLYARKLAPDAQATDLARPGLTSGDLLSQIDDPAIQATIRSASVIVIMVGANDLATVFAAGGDTAAYHRAATAVDANVTAALRRARAVRAAFIPILVLGYWNVVEDGDVARADYSAADTTQAAIITAYTNNALHAAATAGFATYVPTLPAFKGSNGTANPTGLLSGDGDHPNARGHAAIAAALYAAQPTATP
ncbi:MAG: SGNH/GDSL hydrolase family protein [Actinoplanes sp.]